MKKGILFLLLVIAGLLPVNISVASELTDDYFDIATNYFNSNNITKALEYLDLIITIEPGNLKATVLRNKISPPPVDDSKSTQEAAKILTESPELQKVVIVDVPQADLEKITYDSDYYNNKGLELYQKKDFDTAIEYFYKSVTLNNKNAVAYNNLAMAYWCKNNPAEAIKYFKKSNSVNKCYTQPLVNMANIYMQLKNEKKQVECLKKAVKLNPNDYMAYYWLGDYYRNKGEYPKAVENYKEVVKINPKFSKVYLSLAICFLETEEFNYAVMALEQYRGFCPDSDYTLFLMAKARLALCQYESAKEYMQRAIQINDNNNYQYTLAQIEYNMGNYQAALDIFTDVLQSCENAETFNYVALCNYKLKNIEAAVANFNKAIELDGLRPIYYYNLAQCYKSMGDKKNYAKYVNTSTKITPVNYQDFIDLSYIYYDNSNPGYAINTLNSAIAKYPNVKSLYLSKLRIYEAIGDDLHYNETKNIIDMRFNKK